MSSQYIDVWVEVKVFSSGYGVLVAVLDSYPESLYDIFCYEYFDSRNEYRFVKVAHLTELSEADPDNYPVGNWAAFRFSSGIDGLSIGWKLKLVEYPEEWKFNLIEGSLKEYTIQEIVSTSPDLVVRVEDRRPTDIDGNGLPFLYTKEQIKVDVYNASGELYQAGVLGYVESMVKYSASNWSKYRTRIAYNIYSTLGEADAVANDILWNIRRLLTEYEEYIYDVPKDGRKVRITGAF